jgi:hypothetical protein
MDKKLFLEEVRGLMENSQPSGSGGLVGWLRKRIDQDKVNVLLSALGASFDRETLYRWLEPEARTICCSPGCTKKTTFVGREMTFKRYCSAACSWKDPATIALREANELARSGGSYHNVFQRPDVRATNSAIKRTKEYKDGIRSRELERSNGEYSDPRGRKDANEKRAASHRNGELERSNGQYTNSSQRSEVRKKIQATLKDQILQDSIRESELVRSGGLYCNAAQRPSTRSAQRRSAFGRYEVSHKDRNWSVQGYEDAALRFFVERGGVNYELIDIPGNYESFAIKTENSKRFSRYIPDFIIGESLYVEVKSTWTARIDENGGKVSDKLSARGKAVSKDGKSLLILIISNVKGAKGTGFWRSGDIHSFALFSPESEPLNYEFSEPNLINKLKDYYGK